MKNYLTKRRIVKIYEIMLPVLALISLFTLMSLGSTFFRYYLQPKFIFFLNHFIWLIFTADFFVRMHLTEDRKYFITRHLAELTAIIPLYPFTLLAKLLNDLHMANVATGILEFIFIIKFFSYLIRAFVTQRRFIKTNLLHYAAAVTMTALVVASMLFSSFEGKNYSDSIWWAVTTASTTGFGDIVPVTQEGRIVGMFLMIVGLACISMLTGVIAGRMMNSNTLTNSQNSIIMNVTKELSRFSELTASEVDDICTVLKAMKEKHPKTSTKSDIEELPKDNSSQKTFLNLKSGHFAKWLVETFTSDPDEDLIIENKLSGKNRSKK